MSNKAQEAAQKYVQQRYFNQENEDLYVFKRDKFYLDEPKKSPEPVRKSYFKQKKPLQTVATEEDFMPTKGYDDKNVKAIHIEGAKKTLSENSPSPYKMITENIEDEIVELKSIKSKLQKEMKDQKWDKIPKIFKYAAELHSKEVLGMHRQIYQLKSQNSRLQQEILIRDQDKEFYHDKAKAAKNYNKILVNTVQQLKSQTSMEKKHLWGAQNNLKGKKNLSLGHSIGQSLPLTSKEPTDLEEPQKSLDDFHRGMIREEGNGSSESLVMYQVAAQNVRPQSSKSHFLKPKNLLSRSSQGKVGLSKRLDKVPLESLQSIEHGQTSGTNNTSNIMQSRSFAYAQFDNMDTNYTSKTKLGVANSRPITAIPKIKSQAFIIQKNKMRNNVAKTLEKNDDSHQNIFTMIGGKSISKNSKDSIYMGHQESPRAKPKLRTTVSTERFTKKPPMMMWKDQKDSIDNEKDQIIADIKQQLKQLQKMNENYKKRFSKEQIDLQELFFDCAFNACKMKGKRKINGKNISEKTQSLIEFVTNKHVLNVLYEVMFKFQKVQERIGVQAGVNQGFNLDLENIKDQFLTEVQPDKQVMSRDEARKLALFKLTNKTFQKPPIKKQVPIKRIIKQTIRNPSPPPPLVPEPLVISHKKDSQDDYILEQEVKFPQKIEVQVQQVELDAIISTQNISMKVPSKKSMKYHLRASSNDMATLSFEDDGTKYSSPTNNLLKIHEMSRQRQYEIVQNLNQEPPSFSQEARCIMNDSQTSLLPNRRSIQINPDMNATAKGGHYSETELTENEATPLQVIRKPSLHKIEHQELPELSLEEIQKFEQLIYAQQMAEQAYQYQAANQYQAASKLELVVPDYQKVQSRPKSAAITNGKRAKKQQTTKPLQTANFSVLRNLQNISREVISQKTSSNLNYRIKNGKLVINNF